jgi:hypothetical protein
MKRKRRDQHGLSLSFLDCICCGFGAILLLLILGQAQAPKLNAELQAELKRQVAELRTQLAQLDDEQRESASELAAVSAKSSAETSRDAKLETELASLRSALTDAEGREKAPAEREAELQVARQQLSEEMKRLSASAPPRRTNAPIGGIPVDSEYVIFVIDTSPSMANFAWGTMTQKIAESFEIYPQLKGIQVLDDEGGYMFPRFKGRWLPDSPERRKEILDTLRTWRPFSNSSPVEGIEAAIRDFYAPDRKISIFVLSDDYSGNSLAAVVKEVDRLNHAAGTGERLVRIHAIGFPVQYRPDQVTRSGYRFAHLMRVLCERNGGAFVGLPNLAGSDPTGLFH